VTRPAGYSCETYRIDTVAGNGVAGAGGDDRQAITAQLNFPAGIALDAAGNLYIADKTNNRIRQVDLEGVIRTFAGGGALEDEGAKATEFKLSEPLDIAIGLGGLLFIADSGSHRILSVDTEGAITTYAGSGVAGVIGDGQVATLAELNTPNSLAVHTNGDLYIADRLNHKIRRVFNVGRTIETYAGSGTDSFSGDDGDAVAAALSFPRGISLDSQGNLFIADRGNHRIRRVRSDTRTITTIAGTGNGALLGDQGQAINAELNTPSGVAHDALDNLLIADKLNHRIRLIEGVSTVITTLAGRDSGGFEGDGGDASLSLLNEPVDVAVGPDGKIYIVDQVNNRIRSLEIDRSDCDKGICREGNCAQDCREASCQGACAGGGCTQACAKDSTCHFSCARGGCTQTCEAGASCYFSCLGGGCVQTSMVGAEVLECPGTT
jgi:sugar lactone lactonase YvrE